MEERTFEPVNCVFFFGGETKDYLQLNVHTRDSFKSQPLHFIPLQYSNIIHFLMKFFKSICIIYIGLV
jgi:hypothetical protein